MTRRRSPRPSSERPGNDLRGTIQRLARKDLRTTAAFAFGVGVLLHAGVAFAVLGGGPSGGEGQVQAPAAPVAAAPPPRPGGRRARGGRGGGGGGGGAKGRSGRRRRPSRRRRRRGWRTGATARRCGAPPTARRASRSGSGRTASRRRRPSPPCRARALSLAGGP